MTSRGGTLGGDGEFAILRKVIARAASPDAPGVLQGPGDDGAVLEGGWVISTDQMVEGVHFRSEWLSDAEVGERAVRAGLSDLAAMAAEAVGVLVSLAVPRAGAEVRVAGVMDGVMKGGSPYGAVVLGGDLSSTMEHAPLVLDIVSVGRAQNALLRGGTQPGDEIWVTGPLGGAAAAVLAWEQGRIPDRDSRAAFCTPHPRIREAIWLQERAELHAGIDLSDGLLADAGHLAAASGVRLVIDADSVPRHPTLTALPEDDADRLALTGGEDYELLLAAPPGALDSLSELFAAAFGAELERVGHAEQGAGVAIRAAGGHLSDMQIGTGYDHFPSDRA